MTPAQTAELLGMCAAFDRRTVGRADVTAWHLVLQDVDYTDAQQAVADHYRDNHDWIMPSDVRAGVRRIRDARIEAAHVVYDGNPIETGADSSRSLRGLVGDAASGRLPARSIGAALEPGPDAIRGRKLLELEAAYIGQPVPTRRAGAVNVLGVPCPHCAAPRGQVCVSGKRKQRRHADAHPSRLDAARRQAAGLDDTA